MTPNTSLTERLARVIARVFYRVEVVGRVPPQGPLLLLPNHPNALLDPAIVIATARRPVRFIAKSTLFDGPLAPIVRASGAIPVFRKQDEGVDAKRNAETFAAVDEALRRGDAICIFPEGISHSTGRLEPLRTGAARMALSAAARGVDVQLVPVGINPEEKTSFRSRMTIVYGRPFSVRADTPVPAVTAEIAERMRRLIVEANPQDDAELVMRIDRLYTSERETDSGSEEAQTRDPAAAVERRRVIASGLQRLREKDPERYESALLRLRRYDQRLRRFGLRDHSLDQDPSIEDAVRFVLREVPLAILLVPVAAAAVAVFAVPYFLTAAVGRLQRETDITATAKVLSGAVFYGAWMLLIAILVGFGAGIIWGAVACVALPLLAAGGLYAIERESAALHAARSWLALRGAHPTTRRRLRRDRAELADLLDEINAWTKETLNVER